MWKLLKRKAFLPFWISFQPLSTWYVREVSRLFLHWTKRLAWSFDFVNPFSVNRFHVNAIWCARTKKKKTRKKTKWIFRCETLRAWSGWWRKPFFRIDRPKYLIPLRWFISCCLFSRRFSSSFLCFFCSCFMCVDINLVYLATDWLASKSFHTNEGIMDAVQNTLIKMRLLCKIKLENLIKSEYLRSIGKMMGKKMAKKMHTEASEPNNIQCRRRRRVKLHSSCLLLSRSRLLIRECG